MAKRTEALQSFIDAAHAAFDLYVQDQQGRRAVGEVFEALKSPMGEEASGPGSRLPVCSSLDAAAEIQISQQPLRDLIDRFRAVEPLVTWSRRPDNGTASANYVDGHGNAMIVGPGGIEERPDAWLGMSLLAPNVRYPDHTHAPEEVYLVVSGGEFSQDGGAWFSPGISGTFYNRPNIKHAMRSTDKPLMAFWILQPERSA